MLIIWIQFVLHTILKTNNYLSFIGGEDTLCVNEDIFAEVYVDFNGIAPFTFVYEIDGITQPSITTNAIIRIQFLPNRQELTHYKAMQMQQELG